MDATKLSELFALLALNDKVETVTVHYRDGSRTAGVVNAVAQSPSGRVSIVLLPLARTRRPAHHVDVTALRRVEVELRGGTVLSF